MTRKNDPDAGTKPGSRKRKSAGTSGRPGKQTAGATPRKARESDFGFLCPIFDDLSPFEVPVPELWRAATTPNVPFPHRCFEQSALFVVKLGVWLPKDDPTRENLWLVHGRYLGGFPHGWVELPGDVVFDGVNQRFYRRADYYRVARAEPWYRYDLVATAEIGFRSARAPGGAQMGDWHTLLGLPDAPPQPRRVTASVVQALADPARRELALQLLPLEDLGPPATLVF